MYIDDSMVNTKAWIKATRHSSMSQNTPKSTDTTLIEPKSTPPYLAIMKIMHTSDSIRIWPAIIFAKSLIVRDIGFMIALKTSIIGIIGLRKPGTSGRKISL